MSQVAKSLRFRARSLATHINPRGKVYNPILHHLLQLLLCHPKRRLYLVQRVHEIRPRNLQMLHIVKRSDRPDLDVPIKRKARGALDQAAQLRAREIFRQRGELGEIDVVAHDAVGAHLRRVNVENLESAGFVGQRDFNVHFETARTEEGFVNHVHAVRHANDEDIVELVHAVHLGC